MNKNRKLIWEKTNGHCWYCGIKLGEKGWHIDHVEPVKRNLVTGEMSKPERDSNENKVPACASCNLNKHSLPLETWREVIKGYVTSLNRDSTQYKVAKRYGLIEEKPIEVRFWFEENMKH
ncbi:HNH endonuclease [Shouchella rhizosphaerae]|uniref:HNH endonuclease n=1 Tax=Shouchella rhizosphaerae TaxID=866786 RepID=UPI003F8118CF